MSLHRRFLHLLLSVLHMGLVFPHIYSAYGLQLCSDIPFPELDNSFRSQVDESDVQGPVRIRYGEISPFDRKAESEESYFSVDREHIILDFPGIARFAISGGVRITVDPYPDVEEGTLHTYILGIGLAILLHQRGSLVLHASGVSVDGWAALFLGQKGAGKSTLAAVLNERGFPFVTDDIAPLEPAGDGGMGVRVGLSLQKLWPDALHHLGRDVQPLPRLHSTVEKRLDRVRGRALQGTVPVAALYVLEYGSDLRITPLHGFRAFQEIVKHSFIPSNMMREMGQAQHFAQCDDVLRSIPIFRVQRPKDLDRLPGVVDAIEAHQGEHWGTVA